MSSIQMSLIANAIEKFERAEENRDAANMARNEAASSAKIAEQDYDDAKEKLVEEIAKLGRDRQVIYRKGLMYSLSAPAGQNQTRYLHVEPAQRID